MNAPTTCRYCGGNVILCDSSEVYHGKSYGNIYLCTRCRAYVGVNKKTNEPLGTLADTALREKRKAVRALLDAWWKAEDVSPTVGYKWLSKMLNVPAERSYIGYFDADMCDKVIELCREMCGSEVA